MCNLKTLFYSFILHPVNNWATITIENNKRVELCTYIRINSWQSVSQSFNDGSRNDVVKILIARRRRRKKWKNPKYTIQRQWSTWTRNSTDWEVRLNRFNSTNNMLSRWFCIIKLHFILRELLPRSRWRYSLLENSNEKRIRRSYIDRLWKSTLAWYCE